MATKTAKKVAKKTTKKQAAKSSAKKGGKEMKRACDEQCFWVTNGLVLSDVVDLQNALQDMVDEVFLYHVTKEKNDFADWVEFVLEDAELAAGLRKARKPKTAHTVVVRRLKVYNV